MKKEVASRMIDLKTCQGVNIVTDKARSEISIQEIVVQAVVDTFTEIKHVSSVFLKGVGCSSVKGDDEMIR